MVLNTDLLKNILSAFPVPLVLSSADGAVLFVNQPTLELVGAVAPDLEGHNLQNFFSAAGGKPLDFAEIDTTKDRVPVDFAVRGTLLPLELTLRPVYDPASKATYLIAALRARRDSGPTARSIHMTSKLESLGALAGGVAHDLNNILTGILGHVSFLRLALPESGPHRDSLRAIEEGARRAASMTQQILAFVRESETEMGPVNFSRVIVAGANLLRGGLPKNVEVQLEIPAEDISVVGDETNLSQLFLNLAVNARDALEQGGRIHVQLAREFLPANKIPKRSNILPGEYVRLTVSDNGMGIPPQIKEKIFEPFFTTKTGSQGTGLGLATVVAIVKSHQGAIDVESEVGVGASFHVYLKPALNVVDAPPVPEEQLTGGSECILVVDDEEVVRTVMQRSLEHLGYLVETATDGADAVTRFRHNAAHYQLVILDMMMPKLAGDEVFKRLQQIDPNVRVLLASGYSSEGRAASVLKAGALGFIQKPFAVEDLAREVRRCLDMQPTAPIRRSVRLRDEDQG